MRKALRTLKVHLLRDLNLEIEKAGEHPDARGMKVAYMAIRDSDFERAIFEGGEAEGGDDNRPIRRKIARLEKTQEMFEKKMEENIKIYNKNGESREFVRALRCALEWHSQERLEYSEPLNPRFDVLNYGETLEAGDG